GANLIKESFLFIMIGLFVAIVFITKPIFKKKIDSKVIWLDILLFIITITLSLYFSFKGKDIVNKGWEYGAPTLATYFSYIYWIVILEALRRSAGLIVTFIALIFSIFPLFTDKMS